MFYWDDNNRFKPKTTVTTLATRGAALLSGGDARLLGERGGAAGAFAAEAALSILRGVMQRPATALTIFMEMHVLAANFGDGEKRGLQFWIVDCCEFSC